MVGKDSSLLENRLVPTMKLAAALLLTSFNNNKVAVVDAISSSASKECCLCGHSCADVAPDKRNVITLSPFASDQATSCEEIAMDLLDNHVKEEEEMCAHVRSDYQEACCSFGTKNLGELKEEEEGIRSYTMESFNQGARELVWTATTGFGSTQSGGTSTRLGENHGSSSNNDGGYSSNGDGSSSSGFVPCTYEPVGVDFPTEGGNFAFGICRNGDPPLAVALGVTIFDPNLDRMFQGQCSDIERLTRNGYLSNNMCAITRIRLDEDCCANPTLTTETLEESWGVASGSPSNPPSTNPPSNPELTLASLGQSCGLPMMILFLHLLAGSSFVALQF